MTLPKSGESMPYLVNASISSESIRLQCLQCVSAVCHTLWGTDLYDPRYPLIPELDLKQPNIAQGVNVLSVEADNACKTTHVCRYYKQHVWTPRSFYFVLLYSLNLLV